MIIVPCFPPIITHALQHYYLNIFHCPGWQKFFTGAGKPMFFETRFNAGWIIMKACFSFSYLGYKRSSWRAKQPLFQTEMRPKHSEGPCFNEFDSRMVLLKSSSSNYLANNGMWEEEIEGGKTASCSPTSHPHAICSQNLCFIIIIGIVTVTGLCFTSSSSSSLLLLLLFFLTLARNGVMGRENSIPMYI